MGFYPLKISLADKTTGLPITTYDNLNLRSSPYTVADYAQLSKSGGTYEFGSVGDPIESGDYKLYDNETELTAFGIIRIGEPTAVLTAGNFTVTGDNIFSGDNTFSGLITADNIDITGDVDIATGGNLTVFDAPTNPTDVVRLTDLSDYAVLDGGNEFNDTQVFQGTVEIAGACDFSSATPTCASADGTEGANYLINQGALQDAIDSLEITPFQESSNTRRLIIAGIQDTNKVYTTWAACQDNARQYAGNNWRITIEIKGAGESSNNITVTDGSLPGNNPFNDFVNVKGDNQGIKLQVSDVAYSLSALGNSIIENVAIELDDDHTSATPTFENFVFKDVYFNFDTQSLGFINCKFLGNCYVKNEGTISFDGNCIGGDVATNGAITARMFGIDGLTSTDF